MSANMCNTTLEDIRIGNSEVPFIGDLTFHYLSIILAAAFTLIAVLVSFFLIFMHATHYTKPYEQKHIIRILFMIPIYSTSALLSLIYYWHAVYFKVLSDCYESIAIASFFALLCHYIAPNLHEQKQYFRNVQPKHWVWPVNWLKFCCSIAWRTPRSGLTWFNIIWTGVYQYCFIRVAMTIVAVVSQYFGKYCESSQSPQFAQIWVLVIEGIAVAIAMYCLVQFYVQLRENLAQHSPFLKILAIKLVIFLSFWQNFLVSILNSPSLKIAEPNSKIAYPDLKIGIPSLLLCIEMAFFAILHLYSFPYHPYTSDRLRGIIYPRGPDVKNELGPDQSGFLGFNALIDVLNPWDLVKGIGRVVLWLVIGRKTRESDISYKNSRQDQFENFSMESQVTPRECNQYVRADHDLHQPSLFSNWRSGSDEDVGLITHAQPYSLDQHMGYVPAKQRYNANGEEIWFPNFNGHSNQSNSTPDVQVQKT